MTQVEYVRNHLYRMTYHEYRMNNVRMRGESECAYHFMLGYGRFPVKRVYSGIDASDDYCGDI